MRSEGSSGIRHAASRARDRADAWVLLFKLLIINYLRNFPRPRPAKDGQPYPETADATRSRPYLGTRDLRSRLLLQQLPLRPSVGPALGLGTNLLDEIKRYRRGLMIPLAADVGQDAGNLLVG